MPDFFHFRIIQTFQHFQLINIEIICHLLILFEKKSYTLASTISKALWNISKT